MEDEIFGRIEGELRDVNTEKPEHYLGDGVYLHLELEIFGYEE